MNKTTTQPGANATEGRCFAYQIKGLKKKKVLDPQSIKTVALTAIAYYKGRKSSQNH